MDGNLGVLGSGAPAWAARLDFPLGLTGWGPVGAGAAPARAPTWRVGARGGPSPGVPLLQPNFFHFGAHGCCSRPFHCPRQGRCAHRGPRGAKVEGSGPGSRPAGPAVSTMQHPAPMGRLQLLFSCRWSPFRAAPIALVSVLRIKKKGTSGRRTEQACYPGLSAPHSY